MFTRVLALLAAGAVIAPATLNAAPVIIADGDTLTRQVHVRTDDLNLASAAGQRVLRARVAQATNEVCATAQLSYPVARGEVERCQAAATADTKPQIADVMARATPRYAESKPVAPASTNTADGS